MLRRPASDDLTAVATRLVDRLRAEGATVATAESLTGGRLAAALTAVPGASAVYRGGVVTYATDLKVSLLGVPQELVDEHGVVSADCAAAMAGGARRVAGATYALATTGVAGPDPQEGRPVGTVFVGVAGPEVTSVLSLELAGTRAQIQESTCREALLGLLVHLDQEAGGPGEPHDDTDPGDLRVEQNPLR
ncbi:CinA family protein [Nocardioides sp. Leaf307]|uniref:CinA family protein n=1 Tax=Nocardioides sp. Leaf307 TaxID=1736331 RepID=UPI0009E84AAE|nr:CinA family protein [Nocardioides sp. Leaf307]